MREMKGGRYMDKKMNFKYFYGIEAYQMIALRIFPVMQKSYMV